MNSVPDPAGSRFRDGGASVLRTVVPAVWGTTIVQVVAVLGPHLPGDLGPALAGWLASETTVALVSAAAVALWYAVARRVEQHIPDWLTRVVLGSAARPAYPRNASARARTRPRATHDPTDDGDRT